MSVFGSVFKGFCFFRVLNKFGFRLRDVGKSDFIRNISKCITSSDVSSLAMEFDSNESDVQLIIDVLTRPFDYDLRVEKSHKPVFKTDVRSLKDLALGMVVQGKVLSNGSIAN